MADDSLSDEYNDLSENMRHYASLRFAQLTLYFAFVAGLVTVLFLQTSPLPDSFRLVLKIIGFVGSVAFGVMEKRAADYWHHFCHRAIEIEDLLGYRQYASRPVAKLISATNAARVLTWGGALLWILAAVLRV
jgi:hypothetical protein